MMPRYTFKFQEQADEPALARLAQRLANTEYASWPLQVDWGRKLPGAPDDDAFAVRRRRLLLCENQEVRAFHNFFEHELYLDGKAHALIWPNGALSEGIIDREYAFCYPMLLKHSLKLQPLHLAMGGSLRFRQILARLGWKQSANLAQYLLPLRPAKVLREMAWFQRTPVRKFAARMLAWSGLGTMLGHAVSGRKRRRFRADGYRAESFEQFGAWADELWRDALPGYRAVTRRDAATMNRLYRPGDARFCRVLVRHRDRPVGWFLYTTQLKPSSEMDLGFGRLRVGALFDTFGFLEHARPLLSIAVTQMSGDGVDLIFGHWTHAGWCEALRDVGFLRKQTAYPLSAAPAGEDLMLNATRPLEVCHFTDGDCDGPYYVHADTAQCGQRSAA